MFWEKSVMMIWSEESCNFNSCAKMYMGIDCLHLCMCSRYCMSSSKRYHALWNCAVQFQSTVSTLYYVWFAAHIYIYIHVYIFIHIQNMCVSTASTGSNIKVSTDELEVAGWAKVWAYEKRYSAPLCPLWIVGMDQDLL